MTFFGPSYFLSYRPPQNVEPKNIPSSESTLVHEYLVPCTGTGTARCTARTARTFEPYCTAVQVQLYSCTAVQYSCTAVKKQITAKQCSCTAVGV